MAAMLPCVAVFAQARVLFSTGLAVLSHALENLLYLDGRTTPDSPDRRALLARVAHSRWLRFAVGVAPEAPMPSDDDEGLAAAAEDFAQHWQSWMGYRRTVIEVAPPGVAPLRFCIDHERARSAAAQRKSSPAALEGGVDTLGSDGPIAFPASTFAIMTAWNPGGEPRPNARANRRANERLAAHLDARMVARWPAVRAPGSRWHEESFAVLGLELAEAWQLAEAFQQRAIYYIDRGRPLLVARRRGNVVAWEGKLSFA
jgi:hypothetical protein